LTIHLFIGENNTGKTSILEVLNNLSEPSNLGSFIKTSRIRETDYNLRSKIKANLNTRIKLSVLFNKEMQRKCNEIGVNYLNLDSEILNKDGYVKKELIKKKKDHHYNYDVYSGIIKNRLKEINF
jgi:predicted ATP-dependent endonuclease of OLD family